MYIPTEGDFIKFRAPHGRSYQDLYGTVIKPDYNGGHVVEDETGRLRTVLRKNVLGPVGAGRIRGGKRP